MSNENIKKNLLDLNFQKYLVISSTSIIITFTYLIGFGIALMTGQINFDSLKNTLLILGFSTVLFGVCSFLFLNAYINIKNILKEIQNL